MKYLINQRVGVVHTADCPSVRRISVENLSEWVPEKAHLVPGVQACPACLSAVPGYNGIEARKPIGEQLAQAWAEGEAAGYERGWHNGVSDAVDDEPVRTPRPSNPYEVA